jgi:hypothetical protein
MAGFATTLGAHLTCGNPLKSTLRAAAQEMA